MNPLPESVGEAETQTRTVLLSRPTDSHRFMMTLLDIYCCSIFRTTIN